LIDGKRSYTHMVLACIAGVFYIDFLNHSNPGQEAPFCNFWHAIRLPALDDRVSTIQQASYMAEVACACPSALPSNCQVQATLVRATGPAFCGNFYPPSGVTTHPSSCSIFVHRRSLAPASRSQPVIWRKGKVCSGTPYPAEGESFAFRTESRKAVFSLWHPHGSFHRLAATFLPQSHRRAG
jgi:hypothetical protein